MHTIIDPIRQYSETTPTHIAVGDAESGRTWTWLELDAAVDRCAAWLTGRLGSASGERVAVIARNHPRQLILQFACIRAGAIFVPLNWRLAAAEISQILTDVEPKLIFKDAEFNLGQEETEQHELAIMEQLGQAGDIPPPAARRSWSQASTLLYTSGTSGRPKGVMVTEENAFWSNTNFSLGSLVDSSSVFLCDLPMFHTAGLFAATRVPILAGGTVWISAGFDPVKTIDRIANPELGISHYFSVPQMATTLWQHPNFSPEKFSKLRLYVTGGAPNPKVQVERFAEAGIRFSDGFGMTETGSCFAMPVLDKQRLLAKAGSCGIPLLTVQARIVDDHGADVTPGATGELWLQGPSITPGYWGQAELTAAAFSDGWFKTGDAAYRDQDGFYFLVDRKKDMYISGGENVYPAEVEAVISELTDVAEVAVIGVPNDHWGEVGRAFIVLKQGGVLDQAQVLDLCRQRLAKFKIPVSVEFPAGIPRTASGKVQKHLLPRNE